MADSANGPPLLNAKYWTQTRNASFTLFSCLPTELRLLVWQMTLRSRSRILIVEIKPRIQLESGLTWNSATDYTATVRGFGLHSVLFRVNREARREAQHFYRFRIPNCYLYSATSTADHMDAETAQVPAPDPGFYYNPDYDFIWPILLPIEDHFWRDPRRRRPWRTDLFLDFIHDLYHRNNNVLGETQSLLLLSLVLEPAQVFSIGCLLRALPGKYNAAKASRVYTILSSRLRDIIWIAPSHAVEWIAVTNACQSSSTTAGTVLRVNQTLPTMTIPPFSKDQFDLHGFQATRGAFFTSTWFYLSESDPRLIRSPPESFTGAEEEYAIMDTTFPFFRSWGPRTREHWKGLLCRLKWVIRTAAEPNLLSSSPPAPDANPPRERVLFAWDSAIPSCLSVPPYHPYTHEADNACIEEKYDAALTTRLMVEKRLAKEGSTHIPSFRFSRSRQVIVPPNNLDRISSPEIPSLASRPNTSVGEPIWESINMPESFEPSHMAKDWEAKLRPKLELSHKDCVDAGLIAPDFQPAVGFWLFSADDVLRVRDDRHESATVRNDGPQRRVFNIRDHKPQLGLLKW